MLGIDPNYNKMWEKVVSKMRSTAELWEKKSSAIWDRVLQCKALILSKVWYMGPIMPIPVIIIEDMKKICEKFVWNNKPHKIGRCQMRLPKKEGGINWWDIESKVRALQATWVHKYLCN